MACRLPLRFSALFTERARLTFEISERRQGEKRRSVYNAVARARAQTVRSSAHFRAASMHPRLAPNYPSLVVKPRETKRHVPFDAAADDDSTDEPLCCAVLRISSVQLRDRPTSVNIKKRPSSMTIFIHTRFTRDFSTSSFLGISFSTDRYTSAV